MYPFEEAVGISDLIAEVTILEQVAELDEPTAKTIYKAAIVKSLSTQEKISLENIHIMQAGNSKWRFDNNKRFASGESYVLFLKTCQSYKL